GDTPVQYIVPIRLELLKHGRVGKQIDFHWAALSRASRRMFWSFSLYAETGKAESGLHCPFLLCAPLKV
ncbi:MAG: hypothetical protein KGJ80_01895, partial [Chloroflexota bacterium]|nr:hypothetical protein [Chloroflexota bacterium]